MQTLRWRRESRANPSLKAPKFPASRELTGNFIDSGLGGASIAPKKRVEPEAYELIPYAPEQGIFCGLAGNLNPRSGKFLPLIRESRSRLLFCPTNPILPPAPAPAFPSPAMQPSAKASSNPPSSSGESNANPRAPCPASARAGSITIHHVRRGTRLPRPAKAGSPRGPGGLARVHSRALRPGASDLPFYLTFGGN